MIEILIGLGFAYALILITVCCLAIKEVEDDKNE